MIKPRKEDRKLLTDFYMWMIKNDYSHNIRIRVETKAELFLREKGQLLPIDSVIQQGEPKITGMDAADKKEFETVASYLEQKHDDLAKKKKDRTPDRSKQLLQMAKLVLKQVKGIKL